MAVYFVTIPVAAGTVNLYNAMVAQYNTLTYFNFASLDPNAPPPSYPVGPYYPNLVSKLILQGAVDIVGPSGPSMLALTAVNGQIEVGWSARNTVDLKQIWVNATAAVTMGMTFEII